MLLVYGDLAGRMAALVRTRPALIARLVVAPREAVHAIGAFLHLAPDAAQPDVEAAAVIDGTDPRELLRRALPNCPSRLYRALDRAGDCVRDRAFYERLGTVCRGPFADALLGGGALDDARLKYFEALSAMDPAVAALRGALPEAAYWAEAVDCLVALLRAHGALREGDLRLTPRAGLPAALPRLRAALGRIEAPDPGFNPPSPFRLVRNSAELQRIGKAFRNCVALPQWSAAEHHVRLINGTAAYLVADAPPLLVALRHVADRVWYLEQIVGPSNAAPQDGMRATLVRDLTAAGLKIVAADPQSALGRLEQRVQSGHTGMAVELDLGDEDEDDADGLAA
jgi:hypothetical protein